MFRESTGLRDLKNGTGRATVHFFMAANTISFDNGTAQIRDSANQFLSKGALVGDLVTSFGTANNNRTFTVTAAAAGALTVTPAPTTEAAGTIFALAAATGGSLRDIMRNAVLYEYTGSQPATADAAVGTATLLRKWTRDGLAFAHGAAANGINLGISSGGAIPKDTSETWKAIALATGTSGWARLCANPADDGSESTTLPRLDMATGTTSSADMRMDSTSVTINYSYFINSFTYTVPYQAGA